MSTSFKLLESWKMNEFNSLLFFGCCKVLNLFLPSLHFTDGINADYVNDRQIRVVHWSFASWRQFFSTLNCKFTLMKTETKHCFIIIKVIFASDFFQNAFSFWRFSRPLSQIFVSWVRHLWMLHFIKRIAE